MYRSRLLKHLEAILSTGSLAAAAKKNFVAQPSLSQFVKRLETEYEIEIFDRSSAPWQLTEEGKYLLETEREMEALERRRRAFFADRKNLVAGELTIGSTQYRTETLLSRLLPLYRERYPGVQITIEETSSQRLLSSAEAGTADLILVMESSAGSEFEKMPLFEESVVLAVPENAVLKAEPEMKEGHFPEVPLSAAADLPFIVMREDMVLRRRFEEARKQCGFDPEIAVVAQSVVTLPSLIASGAGAALLPSVLAETCEGRGVRCFAVPELGAGEHAVLAWRKGRYLSHAARAFIRLTGEMKNRGELF